MCVFEKLSGLNINFDKCEIFCFGDTIELEEQYTHLFICKLGNLPLKYLGIPIVHRKLRISKWNDVIVVMHPDT